MMIRCVVPRRLVLSKNCGSTRSRVMRSHEAVDAHEGREHRTAQHQRRVDRDDVGEPASAGELSHVSEQVFPVTRDLWDGHERQGEKRHHRVEEAHREPHIAKGLGEDAFRLLLDEVGGALETGDAEHRCGESEEESRRERSTSVGADQFASNVAKPFRRRKKTTTTSSTDRLAR